MTKESKSYYQIIRSTGIFGGAQILNIVIGVLRNKIIAILLGTFGVGLISIYQSILDLIKSLSSFGIETSGVREIAVHADNSLKTVTSIAIIKKWSIVFATLGATLNLILCYPISMQFFENNEYTIQIALLSICTFFTILAAGEAVILQGLRKITYMVKSGLIWNSLGLLIAIPLYYSFRINGIIPVFILVSICMYISAYYYRNKLKIELPSITFKDLISERSLIIKLGLYIVIAAIISQYAIFLIKSILSQHLNVASVGLFQAAWTISNVYLMLILKSMSADFYPRLSGLINDNDGNNRLINQQTHISLIGVTPIIIFIILLSKPILSLLYSSEFDSTSTLLHWLLLGSFIKVISWPLGFVLLARGKGLLFFISELIYNAIFVSSIYLLLPLFGINSVGMGYLVAYTAYLIIVWIFGYRISKFKWSFENIKIKLISLTLILTMFYVGQYQQTYLWHIGIPILFLSLIFSLYRLNKVVPLKALPNLFKNK